LNLHRARVRRHHKRLPSCDFIERAKSTMPLFTPCRKCASDKALAQTGSYLSRQARVIIAAQFIQGMGSTYNVPRALCREFGNHEHSGNGFQ
jgi:hypothetical protein